MHSKLGISVLTKYLNFWQQEFWQSDVDVVSDGFAEIMVESKACGHLTKSAGKPCKKMWVSSNKHAIKMFSEGTTCFNIKELHLLFSTVQNPTCFPRAGFLLLRSWNC